MGIEDDLFKMFSHFNLGGKSDVNSILKTMIRNVEIGMLKQLRKQIDGQIKVLAGTRVGMDPFEILDIDATATKDEVKQAYKKAAWKAHPDHGGSNEEMMKVNAAFEAISRVRGWKT